MCLSSSPNNGFFSIQAALVFLDACWHWSVYNRWQTLQSSIDYIDYDDADEAGRAAMVPVLSIQPSMFSPAVTSAADRPIAASAERRAANWPIRARGRKSLLCAGCEMMLSRLRRCTALNEQMWLQVRALRSLFIHLLTIMLWKIWNKNAVCRIKKNTRQRTKCSDNSIKNIVSIPFKNNTG